jgi:hypothetical protein
MGLKIDHEKRQDLSLYFEAAYDRMEAEQVVDRVWELLKAEYLDLYESVLGHAAPSWWTQFKLLIRERYKVAGWHKTYRMAEYVSARKLVDMLAKVPMETYGTHEGFKRACIIVEARG